MQKAIIGKKIGMTQIFDEHGKVVPVTVIEAGPCVISQKKTVENDGYAAVQMGYGDMKAHKVNKPDVYKRQGTWCAQLDAQSQQSCGQEGWFRYN